MTFTYLRSSIEEIYETIGTQFQARMAASRNKSRANAAKLLLLEADDKANGALQLKGATCLLDKKTIACFVKQSFNFSL